MSSNIKNQEDILNKLRIEKLNPMQEEANSAIHSKSDVVLLSPTGTGKTLAYLLPVIENLDTECAEIQVLILVPSRELALQIEQVTREMGTGYKTNAVYGGRAGYQDKLDLKHKPTILIGTPGRVADLLRRNIFSTEFIHTLVLDEFDKSLEIGFETEMTDIVAALPKVGKRILTSATQTDEIPAFVGLKNPVRIDYLHEKITQLKVRTIDSPSKDKLRTLVKTLGHIGNHPGIIFCNFKETIQEVSDYLTANKIHHGCFFGGMEQIDRERTLIKFRNGTHQLIVATDLAARGLDIPELKFIIHFQLPPRSQEFTHRNGRTARMNTDGTAYILKWEKEELPDFIKGVAVEKIKDAPVPKAPIWETLYITGGRRDKISKGDIAGLFLKQGHLSKEELGTIEIKQDCSYVAVLASKADETIQTVNNCRLKTKKVRVSVV
ncbi:MAG: DEAD/DEAH box helicase [Bacteroidales bacterium]|nr:DEAD/DEAH box helicase [Bacteroidales bacterium]